jgi:hypothetical protein
MTAMARRRSPWADEPRRSSWTPTAMAELLAGYGFDLNRDDADRPSRRVAGR